MILLSNFWRLEFDSRIQYFPGGFAGPGLVVGLRAFPPCLACLGSPASIAPKYRLDRLSLLILRGPIEYLWPIYTRHKFIQ